MFVINFPVKEKTIVSHVDIINDFELQLLDDNIDSSDQWKDCKKFSNKEVYC